MPLRPFLNSTIPLPKLRPTSGSRRPKSTTATMAMMTHMPRLGNCKNAIACNMMDSFLSSGNRDKILYAQPGQRVNGIQESDGFEVEYAWDGSNGIDSHCLTIYRLLA